MSTKMDKGDQMRFHNFLDDMLGQQSKVRVLRFLISSGGEFNGRDIARGSGISHQIAHKALQLLFLQHVTIMRQSGKTLLYKLNIKNKFVAETLIPLFKSEASLLVKALESILDPIKSRFETAILYGSFAEGKERPTSDIDLCLVIKNAKDKKRLTDYFDKVNENFSASFGNIISPYLISQNSLLRKFKQNDPHIINITRKGEVIKGKTISEALIHA